MFRPGFNPNSHRPRPPFTGTPCGTCRDNGVPFTPETSEDLKQHLVAMHGWKRDGNAVYKSRTCEICSKPAFHQYGVRYFCEDHKKYAVLVAQKVGVFVSKGQDAKEEDILDMQKARDSARKHRQHFQKLGEPK